ncbi:Endonuclease/exonuclease/phosphatase [Gautieria morchelliformis]|nr:Endonuclease/exonuclease/phosphatase [Gautieria morchelliformis]
MVSSQSADLRILSFNLRFDSQPDNVPLEETLKNLPDPRAQRTVFYRNPKERPWSIRRIRVASEVVFNRVDLAGFRKVLARQVNDLQELLGSEWDHRGVGRDDGKEAGEFSPIFWKKPALRLLDWDCFWLSNTPFKIGSKYPEAGSVRICTVAHFQSASGELTVLVTHWDEQSDAQRQLAASLILHRAHYEALRTGSPVVLLGDFNSPAFGRDNAGYEIITGARPPVEINQGFKDRYPIAPSSGTFCMIDFIGDAPRPNISGNYATYTGFSAMHDTSAFARIDFIMGGSNRGWRACSHRIGQSLYDDGMYESDHRPVFADVQIP